MAVPAGTEIRSFRAVFDLERRIYRVDRLRLNPSGVPVRGVVYAVVAVACVLIATVLPVCGWALAALPWHVRYVALPVGTAVLATMVRVDGRPLHVATRSLAAHLTGPRRLWRFGALSGDMRWRPRELTLIPDGSHPRLRAARYTGPGAVLVTCEHRRIDGPGRRAPSRLHRADLTVTEPIAGEAPQSRKAIVLGAGARLVIRGQGRRR